LQESFSQDIEIIKPLDPKNPNPKVLAECVYANINKWFHKNLPHSLYFNHYELADQTKWLPHQWKKYLKLNEQFISSELAAITEANARSALQRIATGQLRQGEANALKQLLDRSEQINSNNKNKETVVMHFIPPKHHQNHSVKEDNPNDLDHAETVPEQPLSDL
jgi:hypothetical protein